MAVSHESPVCLAVLNPKGRDPYLDYSHGPECYERGIHPPVNYHAYAAATFGTFYNSTADVIRERDRFNAVIVLIRRRSWISLAAIQRLKAEGITVIAAWKECGDHQIAQQLKSWRAQAAYRKILELADGLLSPTGNLPHGHSRVDESVLKEKSRLIPTPYPLEYAAWDFSTPNEKRGGVMIGTREFNSASRNHLPAIERISAIAHELEVSRVTVVNSEKGRGLKRLNELASAFPADCLNIIEKPLPYPDFLKLLSSHRVVYQMDHSRVPGQVAGDCLLARTLCAGGNSEIERLAFPDLSDDGSQTKEQLAQSLAPLLGNDEAFAKAVADSQSLASERVSFSAVAQQLGEWDILK